MRKVAFVALMLLVAAVIAWQTGLLAPRMETIDDGGSDALGPPELAGSGAPSPTDEKSSRSGATLAQSGRKLTAKTKPATVDGPHVFGKVTDRAGKPVGNARLLAIPDTYAKTFTAKDVGQQGVPVSDAVSDAEGKFVVAVSGDAPYHAIVAEAEGYSIAVESQVPTNGEVTIVVQRAGAYRGTVTDAEGVALVGARVRLLGLADAYRVEIETRTGEGGQYRLADVPVLPKPRGGASFGRSGGVSASLEVTADGYASLMLPAAPAPEAGQEKERNFILSRGAVVVGKVLDAENDAPIDGARVVLWANDAGSTGVARTGTAAVASPYSPRIVGEAVSDGTGAFRIERVPCQGFHPINTNEWTERGAALGRVAAIKDGCCPSSAVVPVGKDGEKIEVSIRVWGVATIEGRVVDAGGAPVKGAHVAVGPQSPQASRAGYGLPKTLFSDAMPVSWSGELAEDGKYRLLVPVSRTNEEEVKLVGRLSRRGGSWRQEGDGSITVRAKGGATVAAPDLVLKADDSTSSMVTKVRVLAPDGNPVWGAIASPQVTGRGSFGGSERTDGDGWTTVHWPTNPQRPLSGPQTIIVTAKGFATTPAVANPAPNAPETLTITMKAAHSVAGRVVKSDGTPAAGLSVSVGDGSLALAQVFPEPKSSSGPATPIARPAPKPGTLSPYYGGAITDDEGRFVVESLPEGPYHVVTAGRRAGPIYTGSGMIYPPSSGAAPSGRATLSDVPSDATSVELVLPVDNAPPTGVLVGAVRDGRTGRPPKGLSVTIRRTDDPSGGGSAGAVPAQWFDSGSGAYVMGGGGLTASIPSPGKYEFPAVPAGSWTVVAGAEGYTQRTADVMVRSGETVTAPTIELERGTTVRGKVRLPDGSEAKGRSLLFTEFDASIGARSFAVPLNEDATYESSGFSPGRWRVMSWGFPSSGKSQPSLIPSDGGVLTVPPGAIDVQFDATLVPSGVLSINSNDTRLPSGSWDPTTATDEQKRFADGVAVSVVDAHGSVVAEQRGGFRRDYAGRVGNLALLPGRYVVKIALPGDAPREEPVDVVAGGNATVVFSTQGVPGVSGVPVPTAPPPPPTRVR